MLGRDPTRKADALAVLNQIPSVPPGPVNAAVQQNMTGLVAAGRLLRAQVLTDQVESTTNNPGLRSKLDKQASDEIDAVAATSQYSGGYEVLKARGRLQLVDGKYRDAIQTFSAAADRLAATHGRATDFALLDWQAMALAAGGQTGEAIRLLERAVRDPAGSNMLQPHQMLAGLYLQDQDYALGRQQVGWVAERYPDAPATIQLQIQALGRNPDPKDVAPLYDRLPERTLAEQVDKASWAARTKNLADAERLLNLVLVDHPGDVSVSVRLAELYDQGGDKGHANEVIQVAMDKHPESQGALQIIKDQINGASEPAINNEAERQIGEIKDPFTREIAYAHLCAARTDVPGQIAHLEAARVLQPDNFKDVLNDLFVLHLAQKDFDKVRAMLPHLADLDADQAHGLMFRFRLATAEGDKDTALALGRQLTHDLPQFASSWESLGEALEASGQLDAAAQQFSEALDRQANNPVALQRLVDCLIRLGRLDDARRKIAEARRKFPDDVVYREQRVRIELAYGDPELVLDLVDQNVKDHPDAADAYQVAAQVYAASAQRRTAKADKDGAARYDARIRQLLTEALKRFPDNATFATELAELQAHDGTAAGTAAAADTLNALAATDAWRGKPLPQMLLGGIYLRANQPAKAEPPLQAAVAGAPEATDARTLLADCLVAEHKPQQALDVLAPAKDQPAIRAKYVDLLLALNRAPEAEAALAASLAAHPEDPAPANLLAHVYAAQGKWDAAQAMADRTLKDHPEDTAAYFVRGTTEAERPNPDLTAASADLRVFSDKYPTNAEGHTVLARVLSARGDIDGATKELEAAVGLVPNNKDARLRLAQAYLAATPPRTLDAQRIINQALTIPEFAHDPDIQRVAALVWLKLGNTADAVAAIRDAMAHAPDQRPLLDEYFGILLAANNPDLLLTESAKFINDPAHPAPWNVYDYRARADLALGDKAAAYADFARALDLAGAAPALAPAMAVGDHIVDGLQLGTAVQMIGPRAANSASWGVVLANCYKRGRDTSGALAAIEQVLPVVGQLAPDHQRSAKQMAGDLYMTAVPPHPDRAKAIFTELLRQTPDDLTDLNNMACILDDLTTPPQPDQALVYSSHAFDLLHKAGRVEPALYDTQGWTLILKGDVVGGMAILRQVVDVADFPDVHYHMAMGYLKSIPPRPQNATNELNEAKRVANAAEAANKSPDPAIQAKIKAAQIQADNLTTAGPQDSTAQPVGLK